MADVTWMSDMAVSFVVDPYQAAKFGLRSLSYIFLSILPVSIEL